MEEILQEIKDRQVVYTFILNTLSFFILPICLLFNINTINIIIYIITVMYSVAISIGLGYASINPLEKILSIRIYPIYSAVAILMSIPNIILSLLFGGIVLLILSFLDYNIKFIYNPHLYFIILPIILNLFV